MYMYIVGAVNGGHEVECVCVCVRVCDWRDLSSSDKVDLRF